jgi:deoxyribonuclease V
LDGERGDGPTGAGAGSDRPGGDAGAIGWPDGGDELVELQRRLAATAAAKTPWSPPTRDLLVAGVFVTFPTGVSGPGRAGDAAWAAAVGERDGEPVEEALVRGAAGAPYRAGLLALREGALLEAAVRALARRPDLVLGDATGRDHPRGAGLALHLGAVLDLPTIGVTNRALAAVPAAPGDERGASAPLLLAGETVGYAVRTQPGSNPLLAHAGFRTTPEQARDLLLALTSRWRTPRPLRGARTLARVARAADEGRLSGGRGAPGPAAR